MFWIIYFTLLTIWASYRLCTNPKSSTLDAFGFFVGCVGFSANLLAALL